jgi:hypothetical protein
MKPHLARKIENSDKDFQMTKKCYCKERQIKRASLDYLEKSISLAEIF